MEGVCRSDLHHKADGCENKRKNVGWDLWIWRSHMIGLTWKLYEKC